MAKVLVTTHWTRGDVLPFFRLSVALRERGHEVVFFSHGVFEPLAAEAGLPFVAWDRPDEYLQLLKDMSMEADPLLKPDDFLAYTRKYQGTDKVMLEIEAISRHCTPGETVLVARHRSSISTYLAAERLGVPIVPAFLAPSYIAHLPAQEELFGEMMAQEVNAVRRELGMRPIRSWLDWMSSVKRCIGFWPDWFAEQEPQWPLTADPVGFPLPHAAELQPLPDEVLAFLAQGEPPVLITGGTSKLLQPEFYKVSLAACELLQRRAIVVTEHTELLPDTLPDGVLWQPFVPLASLYDKVGAVIHHGGIGTLSNALAQGAPQLALAADTDRPDNGMRLKATGAGDYLPRKLWEPSLIAEALRKLTGPEVRARCAQLAQTMQATDAMDEAARVIAGAIGNPAYAIQPEAFTLSPEEALAGAQSAAARSGAGADVQQLLKGLPQDKKAALLMKLKQKALQGGKS
ncbi:glycosyltransferase family 1 protein [Paenibacillus athensensis]|uniref:Erythromycin biosynthesis protein CIII-like C-terminal domain-containing protein n=1 Tax=Paenibacillus athensensis TaxID=1967502 RepID=A0A4Y8PW24_9BACL|nr:glycosyltransferase [Paenibacillus athensensis]MCD1260615.1 glycosyltransferase family 1 protein [Paenibacillus athensensis]